MWSESKTPKASRQWGISSAGRAPALHAGGQEFESPILHHFIQVVLGETHSKEPVGSFLMPLRHAVLLFSSVIRHLKLKCLTHKMINFKFEQF